MNEQIGNNLDKISALIEELDERGEYSGTDQIKITLADQARRDAGKLRIGYNALVLSLGAEHDRAPRAVLSVLDDMRKVYPEASDAIARRLICSWATATIDPERVRWDSSGWTIDEFDTAKEAHADRPRAVELDHAIEYINEQRTCVVRLLGNEELCGMLGLELNRARAQQCVDRWAEQLDALRKRRELIRDTNADQPGVVRFPDAAPGAPGAPAPT